MKLYRCLILISFAIFFVAVCSFNSFGYDEFYESQLESSGANGLLDHLDDEQLELLNKLGIDKIDIDTLMDISPRKILDLFFSVLSGQYVTPMKYALTVAVMIVIIAVTSQFLSSNDKMSQVISTLAVAVISLIVIVPLSGCLSRVVSSIKLSSDFMLFLIPVSAALLTVSGNVTAALSYNSLCFACAQFVSAFASDFVSPVIKIVLSLSVVSSLNNGANFERVVSSIKKLIVFITSFTATVFITMLTLKGMLSVAADGVAVRGIRFLIGNLIPFIGGAVSDAYTSIFGTLKLVKNTVAVFAIAAVSVINLPVFVESLCWITAFGFLSMLADMFSLDRISLALRAISSCLVLLTVLLLLIVIVFILSIGLVMLMSSG